jgi:hypothetical protein
MSEENSVKNWTDELTDEQKEQVWDFIVYTVKEIREQIANDIIFSRILKRISIFFFNK